ncbi:MAG: hypothetical protein M3321_03720 [Actinomycetota bacterium]|nr:hypothetical protein [Actinomycetota bacterium]
MRGLVVALTAAAVLVCAASSGASGVQQTFSDPQGDQQGTAPDVTTIAVSHDASGNITWRIGVANQPTLAADSEVVLWLDTDRNPNTGAPNTLGSEYVFLVAADGFAFARWTGTEFDFDTPGQTVNVSYNAGATIAVNRSEVGNTNGFNFWVRGLQETGPETANIDDAPNDGTFSYVLAPAGPRHGSVATASIAKVRNGMRARFVFRALPVEGSRVRIVWRVNGRQFPQRATGVVRSITSTAVGLGRGLYVAQLQVRPPGAGWRTVASVRRRL